MKLEGRAAVYVLFSIVVLACALGSLTQTVMNSMLQGVEADFGVGEELGQWLATAYMLVLGVTVPAVTYLSQRFSVRQLVLIALGFFLVGAIAALLAPTFWALLFARVLQAVAAGIVMPLMQSVAVTRFPPAQTGTAMGVSGIALGFAPNIGPLVGGALVDTWGWRSYFAILAVLVVLLTAATLIFVRSEKAPEGGSSVLDVPSLALSTLGFGGLLMGFSDAASMSFSSPLVWAPCLVGAVCLVLFVRRQGAAEHPLIHLDVFRSRRFRASFLAQNLLFGSFMGVTLTVPLYVQGLVGGTALQAGLVFLPATIGALVFNPLAGVLSDRIGARPVTLVASTCLFLGAFSMSFMDASTPLPSVAAMQLVRGIGVSSLIGPLNSWGMKELPAERAMDGSALIVAVRQACASLGTALMVLLITSFSPLAAQGLVGGAVGCHLAFGFSAALSAGVLAVCAVAVRGR